MLGLSQPISQTVTMLLQMLISYSAKQTNGGNVVQEIMIFLIFLLFLPGREETVEEIS